MIIIPARLQSSRFPKKILCDIDGVPMFIKSALNASQVDDVVLALDFNETCDIARKYKIKFVLTDPNIPNGTLRVLEASRILNLKESEKIINLQADEPFLERHVIEILKQSMEHAPFMATCAKYIDSNLSSNPNIVKVILDNKSNAIYFSRAQIPFYRDADSNKRFLSHIGIYAYTKESLEHYAMLGECDIENIEKLEQLRALYYNLPIHVNIVESNSIGVDTPHDLELLKRNFGIS